MNSEHAFRISRPTATIRIVFPRAFTLRLRLGIRLIHLAAWVMPADVKVEWRGASDAGV